jgi:hypothetical protein
MDQDAADTDQFGRLHDAQGAISKQCAPDTSTVIGAVDGEPAEDGNWYRLRHIAPEPTRSCCSVHRAGGQCIVSDDDVTITQDKTARCAGGLVSPCATSQPIIQCRNSRIKCRKLVILGERLRRPKFHARSQGAGVCVVRRKRLLGFGGASSRAKNSAYALGLTVNTVRSSNASSAARCAASSTKSVRFLPVSCAARSINPRNSDLMRRLSDSRWGRDVVAMMDL